MSNPVIWKTLITMAVDTTSASDRSDCSRRSLAATRALRPGSRESCSRSGRRSPRPSRPPSRPAASARTPAPSPGRALPSRRRRAFVPELLSRHGKSLARRGSPARASSNFHSIVRASSVAGLRRPNGLGPACFRPGVEAELARTAMLGSKHQSAYHRTRPRRHPETRLRAHGRPRARARCRAGAGARDRVARGGGGALGVAHSRRAAQGQRALVRAGGALNGIGLGAGAGAVRAHAPDLRRDGRADRRQRNAASGGALQSRPSSGWRWASGSPTRWWW